MTARRTSRHPWFDLGWPVLAGSVAGVGVVSAYAELGAVTVVGAFFGTALVVGPSLWSVFSEIGERGLRTPARVSVLSALALVVTMGLIAGFQAWALAILGLVLVTSPLVQRARLGARGSQSPVEETRRAFDEIIAHNFSTATGDDGRQH
jgi:type III secretory pathway component EscV